MLRMVPLPIRFADREDSPFPLEQPHPDRAGEVGRVGRLDPLGVDPRDQRVQRQLLRRGGARNASQKIGSRLIEVE